MNTFCGRNLPSVPTNGISEVEYIIAAFPIYCVKVGANFSTQRLVHNTVLHFRHSANPAVLFITEVGIAKFVYPYLVPIFLPAGDAHLHA